MNDTIVLFPPPDEASPYRWLRIADDAIIARGEGLPKPSPMPSRRAWCRSRRPTR